MFCFDALLGRGLRLLILVVGTVFAATTVGVKDSDVIEVPMTFVRVKVLSVSPAPNEPGKSVVTYIRLAGDRKDESGFLLVSDRPPAVGTTFWVATFQKPYDRMIVWNLWNQPDDVITRAAQKTGKPK